MPKEYDLVVIGTGSAGSAVAYRCRAAGWKVAIIDHRPFGGTCALRGCDPKKVLVGAAEVIERSKGMKGKGIEKEIGINWPELIKFKKSFTDTVPGKREKGYLDAGIDAFHGRAHFIGKNIVKAGDETLKGRYMVIAVGAIPMKLNIPGEEYIAISDQFLETENLPGSITFIGGGYISFEFAHVAARAGAKVRILHRSGSLLKKFDPYMVGMLLKASQDAGIDVQMDMPVNSIEKKAGKLVIHAGENNQHRFESDMVVHGAGRVPDIGDLDLENGGIKSDKGAIVVNEFLQSVSNPSVYAAGDANAFGIPLTPAAAMEGMAVAQNILGGNEAKPDYTGISSVVFTIPPLASAGLQEEDAKKQGINYEMLHGDTSWWYSSRRIGLKYSGYKIMVDKDTKRILGAHLLGHNADEAINIFAMAIKLKLTLDDIKSVLFAYPTSTYDIRYMI